MERCKRHTVSGTKAEEGRPMLPLPLQFLAAWLAVWLGRVLQRQIDYLKEENRALKEQLGDRKLRLTDATRRRLAVLGKELGRKVLAEVATIATPETILRWYREMGGQRLTLGSDAHAPADVGLHLDQALKFIRESGLKFITRYERRQASLVRLE